MNALQKVHAFIADVVSVDFAPQGFEEMSKKTTKKG